MSTVLFELVRPTSGRLSSRTIDRLTREHNWETLCSILYRSGLAPLVYEKVQAQSRVLPQPVFEWFRTQHEQTASINVRFINELNKIVMAMGTQGIPALTIKGPMLAYFGTGLLVRTYRDLDLLVRRSDLEGAAKVLRGLGFSAIPGASRHYHDVYVRPGPGIATVVELHFDLFDRERAFLPDLPGIWERSIDLDIEGRLIAGPSLTDHLLLAIMQLPHHHWSPSIFIDIGYVVSRWKETIDWESLIRRSTDWGMRAVTGAVLHSVSSLLHVVLPEPAREFTGPESPLRRIQWRLVREALSERFRPGAPRISKAASYLIPDRFTGASALFGRRAIQREDTGQPGPFTLRTVHRLAVGALSVSSFLRVLLTRERAEQD